jgi:hypothetical protein
MKKYVLKISLAFGIITALVLILLGLRSCDRGIAPPSYSFLAGRNPISCKNIKTRGADRSYVYSFEANFNDICSKADAELIPAGFVGRDSADNYLAVFGYDRSERYYTLKAKFPRGSVWIYVYNNRRYIDLPDSMEGSAMSIIDGWVQVTVLYGRGWRWPF